MKPEWDHINTLLREIRRKAGVQFSKSEAELFDEFLEQNELGLAFEHLCDAIIRSSLPLPRDVYELVVNVGSSMGYKAHAYKPMERLIQEPESN